MKRLYTVLVAIALLAMVIERPVTAAQTDLLNGPANDWRIVQDRPDGGDAPRITRVADAMTVVTGASSILFKPTANGTGDFTIRAEFHQFDPQRRNEGFGLLFGGQSLSSVARQYSYFLIRQDGSALLKVREGPDTRVVKDWLTVAALRSWEMREEGSDHVVNTVTIQARGQTIRFKINGVDVWAVARSDLPTEGTIGLRVNHGLKIRVAGFLIDHFNG